MTVLTPANAFPNLPFPQHGLPVIWNPNSLVGGMTLSNANLTATGKTNAYAFSSNGGSKLYFEIVIDADTGGANTLANGICDLSFITGNPGGGYLGDTGTHAVGYFNAGGVWINGAQVATIASYATGSNIGVAVDQANSKIWFRVNGGNWNNDVIANQNPATNTGGISITGASLSGAIFAATNLRSAGNDVVTAQFLANSWTYTAPSGFSALNTVLSQIQSFTYPGAVWPNVNPPPPSVLSIANAFPNLAFPQHKSGQTAIQDFLYPGAVQPIVQTIAAGFIPAWAIPYNQVVSGGRAT